MLDDDLSDDFAPQTDDCTCWPPGSRHHGSPMRCAQCVAALLIREAEDGTLGEAFQTYFRDAYDAAHEREAETIAEAVLEELVAITAERAPSLLRPLLDRRGAYAAQLRPNSQRTQVRPLAPEGRWGVLRIVRDDE